MLCLVFLVGMTRMEVLGVGPGSLRVLHATQESPPPGAREGHPPARGCLTGPSVLVGAVKAFLSAWDSPPFKAAPCFPSLTVLMP